MYELNNKTNQSDVRYSLLYIIRFIVFLPFMLINMIAVPLMYLCGIENPFGVWVRFNESVVFNHRND